jgi:serine/threonine protein kinase
MLSRSSGGEFAGSGCGLGGSPGEELPPAGCQTRGRRGWVGGDLMAREWDVPGYTELKTLGSGGFGDVVLARHEASCTAVAIKYLRRQLLTDPGNVTLWRPPTRSWRKTDTALPSLRDGEHLVMPPSERQRRGGRPRGQTRGQGAVVQL